MMMPSIFGENLFDDWMDFHLKMNFWKENLFMENMQRT